MVLGPKEKLSELGEVGVGMGATTVGDPGSSLDMSKAVVCWIVRTEEVLDVEDAALEMGMGDAAD